MGRLDNRCAQSLTALPVHTQTAACVKDFPGVLCGEGTAAGDKVRTGSSLQRYICAVVFLGGCFLDHRFDLKRYWIYRFEAQGALQDLLPDCDTGLDIAWRQPGKTCLTEHAESEHTHPS